MPPKTIAQLVAEEADRRLHETYIDDAISILTSFLNRRPRIDTGEWMVDCQAQMDTLLEYHSEKQGVVLRRLVLDLDGESRLRLVHEAAPCTVRYRSTWA